MKLSFAGILQVIAFAFVHVAYAQTLPNENQAFGKIVDEKQIPLEFATVILLKASDSSLVKTAFTEKDGKFLFSSIPDGKYYLLSTSVDTLRTKVLPLYWMEITQ